jgi:hypothetical protein
MVEEEEEVCEYKCPKASPGDQHFEIFLFF